MKNKQKNCLWCGKSFCKSPHYSYSQWDEKKFCSRSCSCLYRTKDQRTLKKCPNCGKIFITQLNKIKRGFRIFCCSKCRYLGLSKRMAGIGNPFYGKKHSLETRKRLVSSHLGKPAPWQRGDKSNFWKGGVSKINRTERANTMRTLEYRSWRLSIFERDKFTCVNCGQRGGLLRADHIKSYSLFPDLRLDINNGRTLCDPCHKKTDNYGRRNVAKLPLDKS